jgi:benzoyl-CoA 2,3-dioxygenase component B
VLRLSGGEIKKEDAPALSALNTRLRDDYVNDCSNGTVRWDKIMEKADIPFRMRLPHVAFHRQIGEFMNVHTDMDGNILSDAEWERRKGEFLPSDSDRDFIESLMQPERQPGKFAGWIASPKVGIDNKPGDFEYVKIE